MIIPDVNLLLHAHDSEFQRHRAAREWWESLMNGTGSVGLPWVSILGFIRIATHPKILDNPLDMDGACTRIRSWLVRPQTILMPFPRLGELVAFDSLRRPQARPGCRS